MGLRDGQATKFNFKDVRPGPAGGRCGTLESGVPVKCDFTKQGDQALSLGSLHTVIMTLALSMATILKINNLYIDPI